ncbi:MAG TPA: PfkB family carbohydrate kinase, partial [Gemmatimonadales bacterium]|nr:PfkB family carbohydrate kinase [Gemmatimonadales bacterium]
ATIRRAVAATREPAWRLFDVNLRQAFYDADVLAQSLELANAVKLNEEELPVVARLCELDSAPPVDQLRVLCDRFGLRIAALTRGACGSLLVTADGVWDSAAPSTEIVDTVGAGDAFTATLLVGILAERPLDEVNRRANAVAAYVCSQPGATPAIPEELRWSLMTQ